MAQNPLKSKLGEDAPQTAIPHGQDVSFPDMIGRVVTLARDARYRDGTDDTSQIFQDFAAVIRTSGRMLLASDILALISASILGGFGAWALNMYALTGSFQSLTSPYSVQEFVVFFGLGAMALLWLDTKGHYRQRLPYWETVGHIMTVAMVGFVAAGFVQFAAKNAPSRLWLGLSWSLFAILLLMGRALTRRLLDANGLWQVPALLVGEGPTAQAARNALTRDHEMGFKIVEQIPSAVLDELKKPHAWRRFLTAHGARYVFLALEGGELEKQQASLKAMTRERLPCSIVPPWLGLPSSTLSPHHFMMHDVMLLHDTNRLTLPLPRFLKRSFDIVLASAGLVVTLPLFAIVALIVRRDGGPAFFRQQRVGKKGAIFSCYKFRSMRVDAEEILRQFLEHNPESAAEWNEFQKLRNDVRITKFGDFIRRTSLDELPQLINVLKGEMSLVGPRPMMPGQESYYGDDFMYYESVRPGITGPWQVSGRNKLPFRERVALESWYARNWSLWMDIVILLKTVPTLLKKDQAF
jgi:undecaprenyl-phosphate galactose phosphotransferase